MKLNRKEVDLLKAIIKENIGYNESFIKREEETGNMNKDHLKDLDLTFKSILVKLENDESEMD